MEHIWSPWRYRYVSKERSDECIFCAKKSEYILHRAEHNFVLLNLYPYTSGHLMIAPYQHVATLAESGPAALKEMMLLAQRAEIALKKVYNAAGFNMGLNIGEAAGAGVAGHIHMHVLPRWPGDANFMTTIAETRVLPEDLETTYKRLLEVF
ncbi:MAG TPA: HIT domain-containing protein [Bryobacteraceae bacterium]|nr:HIT domain-containing protein [Bryobacteraceae bacterium]